VRILLDESLPRPLALLLPRHEVRTVAAMGWTGTRNGELLQLAAGVFDAFLTADQNLAHQQNLNALPVRPLIPSVLRTLEILAPRQLVHISV
jgi:hypothetical protein